VVQKKPTRIANVMAKRKPYTRYSLLKDLTWGIFISTGLLLVIFAVCRAIALKPLPPEVAQPPREVLANLDLKDRIGAGGGRTAPAGGVTSSTLTSSTLARSLLDLRGVKDEWDIFRCLLKHNPRNQALAKFLALHERMADKAFEKEFDEALQDK
jgi:hypothetical protein